MNKLYLYLLVLLGAVSISLKAQTLVNVNGGLTVDPNICITVQGGITSESGTNLQNNGNIYLINNPVAGSEDWINNASSTALSGTGKVILSSTEAQNITGSFSTTFNRLQINNSSASGVTLGLDANVSDTLILTNGKVHTGANYLIVTGTSPLSVTGYLLGANTPSYINGNLRRYVSSLPATYGFPVGTSSKYFLAEMLTTTLTGVTYFDSKFGTLINNTGSMTAIEDGVSYESMCTEGVWYITPNTPPTSATYDFRAYLGGFNCGLVDNQFAVLKRPDNSVTAADWDCSTCGVGVGLSANGGEGRMAGDPYALRKSLHSFSQFGIGKIHNDFVQLPNDFSLCVGDSASIYAGNFSTYLWSTGSTDSAIMVHAVTPGTFTYYVDVWTPLSLHSSDTIVITVNPLPVLDITDSINISCNGLSDGSATVTASGGSLPYGYSWSTFPVQTSQIATGLDAGVAYSVTVTDANNCSSVQQVTLSEPAALSATMSGNDATCGLPTGSISVIVSGGTAPYSYLWNNGDTTILNDSITAGTYSVTVTDNHNCTASGSVTISNINGPSALIHTTASPTCFGYNDGFATVTVMGGTPVYTYIWNNGDTTQTTSGITAGYYSVTVTDANGCTVVADVTLSQPNQLVATITDSVNVLCNGLNNGSATVSVSGGISGYTYLWSGGTGINFPTVTGLSAGTYTVTVTDINNCTALDSVTIIEPPVLSAVISDSTNISCFGGNDGTATVLAAGGTPGYTYLWSGGNAVTSDVNTGLSTGVSYTVTVFDANNCSVVTSVQLISPALLVLGTGHINPACGVASGSAWVTCSGGTSPFSFFWSTTSINDTISNLLQGVYTVTVTDSLGCTSNATISLIDQSGPSFIITSTDVSCFGGSNGSGTVFISSGIPPFVIAWSAGNTPDSTYTNGLIAGTYSVMITDSNNCSSTSTVVINQPSQLVAVMSAVTNINCFGNSNGSATVLASGGTTSYSYLWSNGAVTSSVSNLSPGLYSVTVTDAHNCVVTADTTLTQPPLLVADITASTNVTCNGGSNGTATVSASGGTPSYTYLWSDLISSTTNTVTNLSANIYYYITVTDVNLCSAIDSIMLTEPTAVTATVSVINANCGSSSGAVILSAGGGSSPYTYSWAFSVDSVNSSLNNLAPGSYYFTVTDAVNCTFASYGTVGNNPPGTLSFVVENVLCHGQSNGSVHAVMNGGTAPFQYLWSNGTTADSLVNVFAGSYNLTVTDANNCTSINTANVAEPSSMQVDFNISNVKCKGDVNGLVAVFSSGGVLPYSYLWSTGSTDSVLVAGAGTYYITVSDANNCSIADTAFITEPAAVLSGLISADSALCWGTLTGQAHASASGGVSPYSYLWSTNPIQSLPDAINLRGDSIYVVTITDANNCHVSLSVFVNQPSKIEIDSVITPASCEESDDGAIQLTAVGSYPPYTYYWFDAPTQNSASVAGLYPGAYDVKVTDSKGCFQIFTLDVPNTPIPCLEIPTAFTPNGDGIHDLWNIKNLHLYPLATIEVYNRWGSLIYEGKTSDKRWDGTYNGQDVPNGSYVFIVNLHNNKEPKQGIVTIIR